MSFASSTTGRLHPPGLATAASSSSRADDRTPRGTTTVGMRAYCRGRTDIWLIDRGPWLTNKLGSQCESEVHLLQGPTRCPRCSTAHRREHSTAPAEVIASAKKCRYGRAPRALGLSFGRVVRARPRGSTVEAHCFVAGCPVALLSGLTGGSGHRTDRRPRVARRTAASLVARRECRRRRARPGRGRRGRRRLRGVRGRLRRPLVADHVAPSLAGRGERARRGRCTTCSLDGGGDEGGRRGA